MKIQKRLSVGAVVAAVALFGSAMIGSTAQAKKKKSKSATVTKVVNAPIPNAVGSPGPPPVKSLDGKLATGLLVGKKFKGTVGRVTVTFQTTGLAGGASGDLDGRLIAPDGTTVEVFNRLQGQSIGPVTFQPNSPNNACSFNPAAPVSPPPPPCTDPDAVVQPPYTPGPVGNPDLNLFNGSKMKGNWQFVVYDRVYETGIAPDILKTSILNSVTLNITPQKPVV